MHEIRFTLACLHARPLPLYVEICEQGSGNEARLLCDWVVPSYDYAGQSCDNRVMSIKGDS